MKRKITLPSIAFLLPLLIVFSACGGENHDDDHLPKALQEEEKSFIEDIGGSYNSRGSYQDLINQLFEEVQEKRPEVASLVDEIEAERERNREVIDQLYEFDDKSKSYYASASSHIQEIKDSIFAANTQMIVDESKAKWKESLRNRDALADRIRANSNKLNDEFKALKIRLTIAQIEDYQKEKVPSLVGGSDFEKDQGSLVEKVRAMK